MVGDDGCAAVTPVWVELGLPITGGILLIADHASNHVPDDVDLGIDALLLEQHIASDIGVAEVARILVESGAVQAAILGGVSRLVVDCNRRCDAPGVIPTVSDTHAIPGNMLNSADQTARLARYYHPYHARIEKVIERNCPGMILSLHSFTPQLASDPQQERPWQIGILYNEDNRLAGIAIPGFMDLGLTVGDQLPYSGQLLNYTMDRHAEARNIPYLGIEMRQNEVATADQQAQMADMIGQILVECQHYLACAVAVGP